MKTIVRTIEVEPTPIELGIAFGFYDDYSQAEFLAAALDEMSSGGKDYVASEKKALWLSARIPADGRTAQWLRALVGYIDAKSAPARGEGKDNA